MSRGRYYIKTWGCQMNVQDQQKMASLLEGEGYAPADSARGADVVLLNTCSVREKSAEKLFDFLGRLKGLKRGARERIIGVTGCVAQQEGADIFRRAGHVDLVLGPRRIGALPAILAGLRRGAVTPSPPRPTRTVDTRLDDLEAIFWDGGTASRPGGKAYITIMEGCNMGCTFCIVPRTRGREAHRAFEEIVEEARRRTAEGILELELLGQTVNAYRDGRRAFHHLLAAVAGVPGLRRLRFTSSHPAFFTANTAAAMADHAAICPHLHLPVQSGSDRMLKAMRRGYSTADYLRRLDDLRRRVPGLAVSTDIIVGYPGETRADFDATLDLLRRVRFSQVFAFRYSSRPGTAAEGLAAEPDETAAGERLVELFALQEEISLRENQGLVGRTLPVLIDGPSRRDPGTASGRTPCNRVVNVPGLDPAAATGSLVDVLITGAHRHSVSGAAA